MEYYRTVKLRINCNKQDFKRLSKCNHESAQVWNYCITMNFNLFKDQAKLLSKDELEKLVQKFKTDIICANNKKIISNKVFEAYRSISKARKAGRTDLKYPYKMKNFFSTEWNYQFMKINYEENSILLTASRYIDERGKAKNGKPIKVCFKYAIPQNVKTLKLLFEHGHYYACISYTVDIEEKQPLFNNTSAIDLGEIHAITSIDNDNNQLIITGRKIRSIKQFRNKKQAELRSKMDKCKKGSRQWRKYRRALNFIKSKARRQLNYHIHKLTRMYCNWAVEKGISAVYCGDVTGIEYGTNDKGNSVTRQKINQWEYGFIMYLLEYKLKTEGIEFKKVNEAYSSQICPCCGFKNKPKNRNYKCSNCDSEFHRDIVGSWNILNFNHKLDFVPEGSLKYLRIS